MQRFFSVGISTLVALMAAHREAANSSKTIPAVFNQADVAKMKPYLAGNAPAAQRTPAALVKKHALVIVTE